MKEVGTSKALHATVPLDGTPCTGIRAGLDATYASSMKSGASYGEGRSLIVTKTNMHP